MHLRRWAIKARSECHRNFSHSRLVCRTYIRYNGGLLAVVSETQCEPAVDEAVESPVLGSDTVDLEAEIAQVCGLVNAGMARLVSLVGQVLETEAWQGWAIHSPEQWVAWKCGLTSKRARSLVRAARRLTEMPETRAAFEAGSLSEDQVAVMCRRARR